jgi:hypothetical protein
MRIHKKKALISIGFTLMLFILISPLSVRGQEKVGKAGQLRVTFDNKLIETSLSALESLKIVGKCDTPKYREILTTARTEILKSSQNGPKAGTLRLLWQIIRYNEIVGKVVISTDTFMKHLDTYLNDRKKLDPKGGLALAMANYGVMYSYRGSHGIIRYNDQIRGDGFVLICLNRSKRFVPWRLNYIDNIGRTKDTYQYDGINKCWHLHYTLQRVDFKDNGQALAQNVFNPVYIKGPHTVPVLVKGSLYAATLDGNSKLTAIERINVKQNEYSDVEAKTSISSFRMDKKKPVPLNPNEKVTVFASIVESEKVKVKTLLTESGMPENIAQTLSQNILKPGDYITVVGATFFKGTPKNLKKGNYIVCGFSRWNVGGEMAYLAEYEKNRLNRVNTGDGAVYDRFNKKTFAVTLRANSSQRAYVGVYDLTGKLQSATLHLDDFGSTMTLNSENRFAQRSNTQLIVKKSPKGRPASFSTGAIYNGIFSRTPTSIKETQHGFYLYNREKKINQDFTLSGLPVNGLKGGPHQMVVSFPQRFQRRSYNFARYNSLTPQKLEVCWPLENEAAVLFTDDQGTLHCKVTQSTYFATVYKTWETTYPTK